jgi:hypothetical protein
MSKIKRDDNPQVICRDKCAPTRRLNDGPGLEQPNAPGGAQCPDDLLT